MATTERKRDEQAAKAAIRQAEKLIRDDMRIKWLSEVIGGTIKIQISAADPWLESKPYEIEVDRPLDDEDRDNISRAVGALASEIDGRANIVSDGDLPIGVYGALYYHWSHDVRAMVRASYCDANLGMAGVKQIIGRTLAPREAVVITCQSQPGGCIVAGSQRAMREMLSR